MNTLRLLLMSILILFIGVTGSATADSSAYGNKIFNPGKLKPVDSQVTVKIGKQAPDFELPSLSGETLRLSRFIGKKNIMLTFIPAAWTPVCSDQWPGYNIAEELFKQYDTHVIGISVDNIPTLFAWTNEMGGLWFDILSDFWPHGAVSEAYGILRTNGVSERAIFIIDKKGILRFIHVEDINVRPDLGMIVNELKKLTL